MINNPGSGTTLIFVYKNGAETPINGTGASQSTVIYPSVNCTGLIYLNGSTDYIEAYGMQNQGATYSTRANGTIFSAFLARGA
jgi:hypothetical protein